MTRLFAGTLLGISLLGVAASVCSAQTAARQLRGWGYHVFETALLVDARPLAAEVLLNGNSLGSAASLATQAISVGPGSHLLEVRAPGHHPYVARFSADSFSSVNRFWVVLVPVRQ